jgi:hypothetical protein
MTYKFNEGNTTLSRNFEDRSWYNNVTMVPICSFDQPAYNRAINYGNMYLKFALELTTRECMKN